MPEFGLDALQADVQMTLMAALSGSAVPIMSTDATAVFTVNIDHMRNVFRFQSDSSDMVDSISNDLRYYIRMANWPTLNLANAMMNHAESESPIAGGFTSNKMMVAHDYTRYLAKKLFGTHQGVDLFNNEIALLQNLRLRCGSSTGRAWAVIVSRLTNVSTTGNDEDYVVVDAAGSYTTNSFTANTNICRELFQQLVSTVPGRFSALSDTSGEQPLPFEVDDIISFKLNINAANGQNLLTGVAPIPPRSYKIKLVMKAAADVVNTAVDTAEL
jgi:hypothetical protein